MRHPASHFFDSLDAAGVAFARHEAGAHLAATGNNHLPEPIQAQIEAGNYKLGRVAFAGLPPIRIENPRNSVRSGVDAGGKAWSTRVAAHYGYFAGTKGADGDEVDVFVGPFPESRRAWVINQQDAKGGFDEHKCMVGFLTEDQARAAYLNSYSIGWTGLQSIVPASIPQLRWWLEHGDTSRPLTADQLPFEGNPIMDNVLWTGDAMPASVPLPQLMYALRQADGDQGLLLDHVTMDELMADPELEPLPIFDALVTEVGKLKWKMSQVLKVLQAAAVEVKPTDFTIADPVKLRGSLQVAVLFTMSDGQTMTIWFHNPDTTPARLTPMDELISWKWMLNKRDVTIVVAPERGRDLNVRVVASRMMRLIEKNSEAFVKANAKAAEWAADDKALDDEIATLGTDLARINRQIEVAKIAKEDGEIAAVKRKRGDGIDPTTAQGYAEVMADPGLQRVFEDILDAFFSDRILSVRNALRSFGWEIPTGTILGHKTIEGATHSVGYEVIKAPSGGNIVGATWSVDDGASTVRDNLVLTAEDLAREIDAAIQPVANEAAVPLEAAAPTEEVVAPADVAPEAAAAVDPAAQPAVEIAAEAPAGAQVELPIVAAEVEPSVVASTQEAHPVDQVAAPSETSVEDIPAAAVEETSEVQPLTLADVPGTILAELDGTEVLSMMRVQDDDGDTIPADKQVFDAAREYFREHIQGRTYQNAHIGDIGVNGRISWGKIKRGLTFNVLRVKLLAAIPALLKKGAHVGSSEIDKERDDGALAFDYLVGWVKVGDQTVEVGVSVVQLERGKYMYNLADWPSELLAKKQSRIVKSGKSPTDSALDSAAPAAEDEVILPAAGGEVNPAVDVLDDARGMGLTEMGLNFYILKVRGAQGEEVELEEDQADPTDGDESIIEPTESPPVERTVVQEGRGGGEAAPVIVEARGPESVEVASDALPTDVAPTELAALQAAIGMVQPPDILTDELTGEVALGPAVNDERQADIGFLHSIISGEGDLLAPGVFERMQRVLAAHSQDVEILDLLTNAGAAVSNASSGAELAVTNAPQLAKLKSDVIGLLSLQEQVNQVQPIAAAPILDEAGVAPTIFVVPFANGGEAWTAEVLATSQEQADDRVAALDLAGDLVSAISFAQGVGEVTVSTEDYDRPLLVDLQGRRVSEVI